MLVAALPQEMMKALQRAHLQPNGLITDDLIATRS
jgi:hypothetical protein